MTDLAPETSTAAAAPAEPPAELTITLNPPAKFAGVEYPQLQLREPRAGELIACDDVRGYAWMVRLAAKVSGVPPEAVALVRQRDAGRRTSSAG